MKSEHGPTSKPTYKKSEPTASIVTTLNLCILEICHSRLMSLNKYLRSMKITLKLTKLRKEVPRPLKMSPNHKIRKINTVN